jgi:Protein of unknown function (DUF3617)
MAVRMKRNLTTPGLAIAGLALTAASLPPIIAGSGGMWEVSRSATGANAERRCVPSASVLAQWEHRQAQCSRTVLSSTASEAVIHYTCPGGAFGQSKMKVITPRTLRIETQGIADGLPFNYVLHARRVGDCPTSLRSRLTRKG